MLEWIRRVLYQVPIQVWAPRRAASMVGNTCRWQYPFLNVDQNDSAAALSQHYPASAYPLS